ncbi:MAG: FMN-binding protein [Succinivibrio sp.]
MKNDPLNKVLNTDSNVKDKKSSVSQNRLFRALLSGVSLALAGTVCFGTVLYADIHTKAQIALNEQQSINAKVELFLPKEASGKGIKISCYQIKKSKYIGSNQKLFVASRDVEPLGYVMTYETSLGYSNPLVMIAGFDRHKNVHYADIQFSMETPGLGDKVDRAHGNYLDQFSGKSLTDSNWDVKKHGGDFDFITGSTITSRATVIATYNALKELNEIDLSKLQKCRIN